MAKAKKRPAAAEAANVIEISSSSSENYDAGEVEAWPPPPVSPGGKKGRKARGWREDVEMWTPRQKRRYDEECLILPADPFAAAVVVALPDAPRLAANVDVAVVAERGKVACRDYPHSRSTCAKYQFHKTSHENYCKQCFCYVCDIAAPCASWKGPVGDCHASDKDKKWKATRVARQRK